LDSEPTEPIEREPSVTSVTTVAKPIPEFAAVVNTTLPAGSVIYQPYVA